MNIILIGALLYCIYILALVFAQIMAPAHAELDRREIGREIGGGTRVSIGDFLKFTFPRIRRTYPKIIADDILSVQPMTKPVGGIKFYNIRYSQSSLGDAEHRHDEGVCTLWRTP